MFTDFNEKFLKLVSREDYRKKIKKFNISFCKLGEECESCLHFQSHTHDVDEEERVTTVGEFLYLRDCEVCNEHQTHMENANSSRAEYRDDKERTCRDIEKILCNRYAESNNATCDDGGEILHIHKTSYNVSFNICPP